MHHHQVSTRPALWVSSARGVGPEGEGGRSVTQVRKRGRGPEDYQRVEKRPGSRAGPHHAPCTIYRIPPSLARSAAQLAARCHVFAVAAPGPAADAREPGAEHDWLARVYKGLSIFKPPPPCSILPSGIWIYSPMRSEQKRGPQQPATPCLRASRLLAPSDGARCASFQSRRV